MDQTIKNFGLTIILGATVMVGACSGGGYGSVGAANLSSGNGNPGGSTPPTQKAAATALFQPAAGVLPYPTDLYFAGSTDGTLNIQPANALQPNQAAVNALDGYSTTAPIRTTFSTPLNPATLTPASVIVIPVITSNTTKATVGVAGAPLQQGVDYTVGVATEDGPAGALILEITPLHPLTPSTCIKNGQFLGTNCATGNGYLVILNSGIADATGNAAVPDTDFATIKSALAATNPCSTIADPTLNGICQLTGAHLQIAAAVAHAVPALAPALNPANIVLTFSFTTESTADTLELLSATTAPQALKLNGTGLSTRQVNPLLPGIANVFVGTLTIPYYLDPAAPLTGSWAAPPFPLDPTSTFVTRFNPLPKPKAMLMIPVLATLPNALSGQTMPASGWPVLIFQHGITRNREDMFAVADSFASQGFAVVAIDQPLHGITSTTDALYASAANPAYAGLGLPAAQMSIERTFDLNTSGTAGQIDSSGSHYLNLTSLLTSRDNLRESVADLITLERSVGGAVIANAGNVKPFAAGHTHYLGHSLGAIVGSVLMGVIPASDISTATLANPGGKIAQLLIDSPSFAPEVNAGLAAKGVTPGTTLYSQFFRDAQTVIDAGDPVNYMALASAQHPIHLIEVVGGAAMAGGGTFAPDQVVPNSATARLTAAGALTQKSAGVWPGNPTLDVFVQFTAGTHGSLLDPTCGIPAAQTQQPLCGAATKEMQTEAIAFAASQGTLLPVGTVPGAPVK